MDEESKLLATLPKELRRLVILSRLEGDFTYLRMEVVTFVHLWERTQVVARELGEALGVPVELV